jgi:hypothetical protein
MATSLKHLVHFTGIVLSGSLLTSPKPGHQRAGWPRIRRCSLTSLGGDVIPMSSQHVGMLVEGACATATQRMGGKLMARLHGVIHFDYL